MNDADAAAPQRRISIADGIVAVVPQEIPGNATIILVTFERDGTQFCRSRFDVQKGRFVDAIPESLDRLALGDLISHRLMQTPMRKDEGAFHRGRKGDWGPVELKTHLAALVDSINRESGREGPASPLDVALDLLGGELEAFVLFGRMGHLDPPREDGKVPIAVLRQLSDDPEIDLMIRDFMKKWISDQERRS